MSLGTVWPCWGFNIAIEEGTGIDVFAEKSCDMLFFITLASLGNLKYIEQSCCDSLDVHSSS